MNSIRTFPILLVALLALSGCNKMKEEWNKLGNDAQTSSTSSEDFSETCMASGKAPSGVNIAINGKTKAAKCEGDKPSTTAKAKPAAKPKEKTQVASSNSDGSLEAKLRFLQHRQEQLESQLAQQTQRTAPPVVAAPPAQVPARVAPATTAAAECVTCTEKVTVIREEKRTDGRCFVQTNMGYKFEVRANASNGRLTAGLVNPQDNNLVNGVKALYVGNLQATRDPKGYDCDGMQAQLYANWEAVRSAYGLPSTCQVATTPPKKG